MITLATGGPEFLDEVRASHTEYGAVLNITEPAAQKAEVNLSDALGRLCNALNVHVSQLMAWGNQSEANEKAARDGRQAARAGGRSGQSLASRAVEPRR